MSKEKDKKILPDDNLIFIRPFDNTVVRKDLIRSVSYYKNDNDQYYISIRLTDGNSITSRDINAGGGGTEEIPVEEGGLCGDLPITNVVENGEEWVSATCSCGSYLEGRCFP